MKNAFIFHGAFGGPDDNWIPWLKGELEKWDYNVIVPQFPTPDKQSLQSWLQVFDNYNDKVQGDTIMIGHSIGATFTLSVLEQLKDPIQSVYLVSGFISDLGLKEFDTINASFYKKSFDWEKINSNTFYLFHGDNDPYVPLEKAHEFAKQLHTEVQVIKNGGHLNKDAGYETFELLVEKIKENA